MSAAEPQTLSAKKVIIATGSTSVMPGFLPKHERVVESRGFLDLTRLPESMLVLGGGFIGCELACMAAMLGVKVTIVELLEDILLLLDPDVRREVRGHMEKSLGIRVLTGKALEKVAADDKGVTGNFGDEVLQGRPAPERHWPQTGHRGAEAGERRGEGLPSAGSSKPTTAAAPTSPPSSPSAT